MAKSPSTPLVDIHSHLYPEWYLDELRRRRQPPMVTAAEDGERLIVIAGTDGVPLKPAFWSVDEKVRFMEEAGIDSTLLSPGNPWLGFVDAERAPEWADRMNGGFASLAEGSDRLFALGALPMSSVEDCLDSVDAAAGRRTLKGFMVGTEICDLAFDEQALEEVWARLDRHGFIVFVHPGAVAVTSSRDGLSLTVGAAFPLETTLAAARLLLAGVPERFPRIRFVLAHGGGSLPFLLGRLDHVWGSAARASQMARRFYTDSLVYEDETLAFVSRRVGADRVAWGSDHPFSTNAPPPPQGLGMSRESALGLLDL